MADADANQSLTKKPEEILAENIETLISAAPSNCRATKTFAKYVGVGNGTIGRLRNRDSKARLATIESIARRFGLEAWQLLVPGLDLANKPRLFTGAELVSLQSKLSEMIEGLGDDGLRAPIRSTVSQPAKRVAHRRKKS